MWMSYDEMVNNLFKSENFNKEAESLMHAAIGVAGEAGELLDAIKKHWVYNKPLDRDNVIEELGDIEFYLQAVRQHLNVSRDEVVAKNIEKLSRRYSSGKYSDKQAQERADKQ